MAGSRRWLRSLLTFSGGVALMMVLAVWLAPAYLSLPQAVSIASSLLPIAIAAVVAVLMAQPASPLPARHTPLDTAREIPTLIGLYLGLLPAALVHVDALSGVIFLLRGWADLGLALVVGSAVGGLIHEPPLAGLAAAVAVSMVWIAAALTARWLLISMATAPTNLIGLLYAVGIGAAVWRWLV